jgi:uncharacterized protein (TIGR00730 family)
MPANKTELLDAILKSPTYRLAYEDAEFLMSEGVRGARLLLELMRPEQYLQKNKVNSTVVVFGSARTPPPEDAKRNLESLRAQLPVDPTPEDLRRLHVAERQVTYARYYEEAREFAKRLSAASQTDGSRNFVIVTGGGPGIMEAANRGAHDVGACSAGFNIQLPHEQVPNPYMTPELAFRFHYFAMRKMHFMLRAQALVAFPGGFGTMDELFEALTLVQTDKVKPIPIVLVGRDYWRRAIDLDFLCAEGFIEPREQQLATVVDSGVEAAEYILRFYGHGDRAPSLAGAAGEGNHDANGKT